MNIVVYVLCDTQEHARVAEKTFGTYSWARIKMIPSTWYLESVAFLSCLDLWKDEWKDAEYVGTVSWRANEKVVHEDLGGIVRTAHERCSADVVAFAYLPRAFRLVAEDHPKFLDVWDPLMETLGYKPRYDSIVGFYANYWATTPRLMTRYIEAFRELVRAMETLPAPLRSILWEDSGYALVPSKERSMQVFGTPYYPHHPFVCERFPCVFFQHVGAKIAAIPMRHGWEDRR